MMLFLLGMSFTAILVVGFIFIEEAVDKHKEKKERNGRAWAEWRSSLMARIDGVRRDLTNAERGVVILTARTDGQLKYVDACITAHEQAFHAPKTSDKKGEKK